MSEQLTVRCKFHIRRGRRGAKQLGSGEAPKQPPIGRVPHVARLMALAIRFEQLLRDGVVKSQAELARLGHVSRARLTQIMNLLNLAPDIQEQILFLPPTQKGRDPLSEPALRVITTEPTWQRQRMLWQALAVRKELPSGCDANLVVNPKGGVQRRV
jgi:hypothetical protein